MTSCVWERLNAHGTDVTMLDAEEFLEFIVPRGRLTGSESEIAMRAVVEAARRLHGLGAAVIVDGTTRLGDGGRLAREVIEPFAQVELVCPPEICRTRERAVRWRLVACPTASRPMARPDLGLDYVSPARPDLLVFTDVLDPATAAEEVVRLVDRLRWVARTGRGQPCA